MLQDTHASSSLDWHGLLHQDYAPTPINGDSQNGNPQK
jgi:hypothetical protein